MAGCITGGAIGLRGECILAQICVLALLQVPQSPLGIGLSLVCPCYVPRSYDTHARTHTHVRTHMHARMHAHTHIRTHPCTHTHIHIHTHSHTHTSWNKGSSSRVCRLRSILCSHWLLPKTLTQQHIHTTSVRSLLHNVIWPVFIIYNCPETLTQQHVHTT